MIIDEFKKNIAPYMRKGWVAMDKNGKWFYYTEKPICRSLDGHWVVKAYNALSMLQFSLEPAKDWSKSLMRCGNE